MMIPLQLKKNPKIQNTQVPTNFRSFGLPTTPLLTTPLLALTKLEIFNTRFFNKSFVKLFHHIIATYQLNKGQTLARFLSK